MNLFLVFNMNEDLIKLHAIKQTANRDMPVGKNLTNDHRILGKYTRNIRGEGSLEIHYKSI